jgi:hypothetical protein
MKSNDPDLFNQEPAGDDRPRKKKLEIDYEQARKLREMSRQLKFSPGGVFNKSKI